VLTVEMIDNNTAEVVRQHKRKMEWLNMERAITDSPSASSGEYQEKFPSKFTSDGKEDGGKK